MTTEEEINDLQLLKGQNINVVEEFCKLAIGILKGDTNQKIFVSASNKLNVKAIQIENAVTAILSVYLKCIEKKHNKEEVCSLLGPINIPKESLIVIADIYACNQKLLLEYNKKLSIQIPQYQDLDWRFDILTCTRAISNITDPVITLQLKLKNEDCESEENVSLLQVDPSTLCHITSSLEDALHKARSHYVRKLQKNNKR